MIGSEGTLGIITEATLRLLPLPTAKQSIQAWYRDTEAATKAIVTIMAQPEVPCALEWMDAAALDLLRAHTTVAIPSDARACLMIDVDGSDTSLPAAVTAICAAARSTDPCALHIATTDAEQEILWKARKSLSPLLRWIAPLKINEDVVVPVGEIPTFIAYLETVSQESGIPIVNFGHAGNGNIHVNLLIQPDQQALAQKWLPQIFDRVIALHGMLSGEHGIGIEKRPFFRRALPPAHLTILEGIKSVFDPYGILNPGKIF